MLARRNCLVRFSVAPDGTKWDWRTFVSVRASRQTFHRRSTGRRPPCRFRVRAGATATARAPVHHVTLRFVVRVTTRARLVSSTALRIGRKGPFGYEWGARARWPPVTAGSAARARLPLLVRAMLAPRDGRNENHYPPPPPSPPVVIARRARAQQTLASTCLRADRTPSAGRRARASAVRWTKRQPSAAV